MTAEEKQIAADNAFQELGSIDIDYEKAKAVLNYIRKGTDWDIRKLTHKQASDFYNFIRGLSSSRSIDYEIELLDDCMFSWGLSCYDDCLRIQRVLRERGVNMTMNVCCELWIDVSYVYDCSWMILPNNDERLHAELITYMDTSIEYYKKNLRVIPKEKSHDVLMIQDVFRNTGLDIDLGECLDLWYHVSQFNRKDWLEVTSESEKTMCHIIKFISSTDEYYDD